MSRTQRARTSFAKKKKKLFFSLIPCKKDEKNVKGFCPSNSQYGPFVCDKKPQELLNCDGKPIRVNQ